MMPPTAFLSRLILAGAYILIFLLALSTLAVAGTPRQSLEIQVSGGAMELGVVEFTDDREIRSNTALGLEPGVAVALRLGPLFAAGLTYQRIVGSVETPDLPGEWGLGSNELSVFVELRRWLGQYRSTIPYVGLGASLGRMSLDDELDLGPGVTELSLAGSGTTARIYGIGAVQLNDRLGFQLAAGFRFGSIPHDELDYSMIFTDDQGRTRNFDADLQSGYVSLAVSTVVWSAH